MSEIENLQTGSLHSIPKEIADRAPMMAPTCTTDVTMATNHVPLIRSCSIGEMSGDIVNTPTEMAANSL